MLNPRDPVGRTRVEILAVIGVLLAITGVIVLPHPVSRYIERREQRRQFDAATHSMDPKALADLAFRGVSDRVRLQATMRLCDQETLRSLVQTLPATSHAQLEAALLRMTNATYLAEVERKAQTSGSFETLAVYKARQTERFLPQYFDDPVSQMSPVGAAWVNQDGVRRILTQRRNDSWYAGAARFVDTQLLFQVVMGPECGLFLWRTLVGRLTDPGQLEEVAFLWAEGRDGLYGGMSDQECVQRIEGAIAWMYDSWALARVAVALGSNAAERSIRDARALAWARDQRVKCESIGRASDSADGRELLALALKDPNWWIRRAAVRRLTDEGVLREFVARDPAWQVRLTAASKCDDTCLAMVAAIQDPCWRVRLECVARCSDENVLARIRQSDSSTFVRYAAVQRMKDPGALAKAAIEDESWAVRRLAIDKTEDPVVLRAAALDMEPENARRAIGLIREAQAFAQALDDTSFSVAFSAIREARDPDLLKEARRHVKSQVLRGFIDRVTTHAHERGGGAR